MTSKYNVQQIIEMHAKYDAEHSLGRQKAMDELWRKILQAASMGECHASHSIGTYCDGQLPNKYTTNLFEFLQRELCKIGKFKIERSIGHSFQCDCDQKQGCREFIKVFWNRDDLAL